MADHPYIEAALAQARYQAAQQAAQDYTSQRGEPSLGATVAASQPLSYDDYLQWMNRNNLPAYRASGAHYSPAGAREGYEDHNLPPIIRQRSPYATAAYRTFVDPFGQMMVQPLVGFPSAYPHVLSGVPTNPLYGFGMAAQLGPLTWPIQYPSSAPFMQQQQAAPQPRAAAAPAKRAASAKRAAPPQSQPAPQQPQMWHYGDPRARADFMPVSPENQAWLASLDPVVQPAAQAGPATMTPNGMIYSGKTYVPDMNMPQRKSSFTPQLLSPEESAAMADGMYVDPNQSVAQNLAEAMGAVSIPLGLGAAGALYGAAPRIIGGEVLPQAVPAATTRAALPSAVRALP